MKTLKVLILADAHDFIRHEGNNLLLLKQLYVTVFLLKQHKDLVLHIYNRSAFGFDVFWNPATQFYNYFDAYLINSVVEDYDIIICTPEYEVTGENVYSLLELQYKCETRYLNVGKLFTKGGLFEITRNTETDAALAAFKADLDSAHHKFSNIRQEEKLIIRNKPLNIEVDKVLILDDYNRPFFIGDSFFWLAKIRKLIEVFPATTNIRINVANKIAFRTIKEVFTNSMPARITFTNNSWDKMNLEEELILVNNDILLKFFWYFKDPANVYAFSAMDERPVSNIPTLDFYTHLSHNHYPIREQNFRELSLLSREHDWATGWFRQQGVSEEEKVFVLIHAASSSDKVIADDEMLTLLSHLDQFRILFVSYGLSKENPGLHTTLSNYENVMIEDSLNLRQTMSLLGNKLVVAIVGPCTGLMHLADGIYANSTDAPFMLTYTGKQGPERVYHPKNWWSNANKVKCCIAVKDERQLIPLHDCPPDFDSFNRLSTSADSISATSLLKQLNIRTFHLI
jgi:hypothetical protein